MPMHSSRRPRPFAQFPPAAARAVRGVLTDIDDTLTSAGAITPDALAGLGRLRAAGIPVIAVTGRSAGWSEAFARNWPLDAIVAENGSVALFRPPPVAPDGDDGDRANDDLLVEYAQDASTRELNRQRLQAVATQVLREVPGATLAADSGGRITDIAVDHAEHAHLPPDAVARVVALMREGGLTATVSSIHVNGWIGSHDKLTGARWMVRRLWGRDLDAEADDWLAIGDSANDRALFERFATSVGVANLMHQAATIEVWPAWLTEGERGAGFAEVAERLVEARSGV